MGLTSFKGRGADHIRHRRARKPLPRHAAGVFLAMVTLNRIYTKTGDKGDTGLGDGTRRPKHDLRIHAYGTVDETNAAIGLARLLARGDLDAMLGRIQNDLFDLGADLATPEGGKHAENRLRIVESQVERLEREMDLMNQVLKPLD